MMASSIAKPCLLFLLLCSVLPALLAQEAGEAVRIEGPIAEDVYAAGGTVDVLATVEGDVVAAGGRVTVEERVSGDVMAAGGAVSVHASVGDDVRLAGGDVRLSGSVGDDAIAAGGNVTLTPSGSVNGRAWLSGGRVDVAGAVGKELKATGGEIVLSGRTDGDVELSGRAIHIKDSAIINGDLVYRSPREADIASGAHIEGAIHHEPVESPTAAIVATIAGVGILVLLSLTVTGIAFFLLFPGLIANAVTTIGAEPWKCLGLGLAVFAATPLVISALFLTVIGWLPAIVIGALYLILLLAGFLTGVFYTGNLGWKLLRRGEVSRSARLWSFVAALILVSVLGLVPLLGTLLLLAVMLLGAGALKLGLYRTYLGQSES
jgi:cytoskeletal protein CcmA (bactofilin family)